MREGKLITNPSTNAIRAIACAAMIGVILTACAKPQRGEQIGPKILTDSASSYDPRYPVPAPSGFVDIPAVEKPCQTPISAHLSGYFEDTRNGVLRIAISQRGNIRVIVPGQGALLGYMTEGCVVRRGDEYTALVATANSATKPVPAFNFLIKPNGLVVTSPYQRRFRRVRIMGANNPTRPI